MPDLGRLSRLLAPTSIAVVGGAPAERVVQQCLKLGFDGPIWPVHPKRADLAGVPCLPSLDDLPGVPDAVFLGVNRHATVEAMGVLSRIGAGGAVCYGSGFAEAGDDDLQERAARGRRRRCRSSAPTATASSTRSTASRCGPTSTACARHERGVAIVSQSGNVAVNLTFQQRGLRLGSMITVGNQASLGSDDAVAALLDDDRITAIGLFLEAVRDAQQFADVAERAAAKRRAAGRAADRPQRGRRADRQLAHRQHGRPGRGVRRAVRPLRRRDRTHTCRAARDAEAARQRRLAERPQDRVAQLLGRRGLAGRRPQRGTALRFEPFAAEHAGRIEHTLTELVSVSNPFDYHTFMWGDRPAMARTFTAVMDGPQDATMLLLDGPPAADNDPTAWYLAADALADAADATGGRAVVVATLAECINEPFRAHIAAPRPHVPARPVRGARRARCRGNRRRTHVQLHGTPPSSPPARTRSSTRPPPSSASRALGVSVPAGRAATADECRAAAAEIGYPITLKALGLAHKSEAGAVKVGIRDAAALAAALAAMPAHRRRLPRGEHRHRRRRRGAGHRPARPAGRLAGHPRLRRRHHRAVERRHPPARAGHRRRGARPRSTTLRSAPLLAGFRGRPAADVEALADLVVRLADAVVGTDVVEVELNPVLVGRHGATAVDALC